MSDGDSQENLVQLCASEATSGLGSLSRGHTGCVKLSRGCPAFDAGQRQLPRGRNCLSRLKLTHSLANRTAFKTAFQNELILSGLFLKLNSAAISLWLAGH